MNKILIGCLILSLTGCNLLKPKPCEPVTIVKTQEVLVPVNECPNELKSLHTPQKPSLFIELIKPDDDAGRVVQMYKGTVRQLLNYVDELEQTNHIYNNSCK